MNARLATLAVLSALALPAAAQEDLRIVVNAPPVFVTPQQLAAETGLSERQVRMMVGAHSGSPEYRVNFLRTQKQFRQALGAKRYNDLVAGRPIPLYRQGGDATPARTLVADVAGGEEDPR